ncbi:MULTISPECIES: PaaI family thioesterase [unclassified Haladaptatus]|uniref:PaaI family thioesterase n=1 Tax=unclassified Haladaptatus TaxID=2622732 RepID=UPI0023E8C1A4|nr:MULTISPECIES: PaaI family thioesterase [unclassified Haladaptatus]
MDRTQTARSLLDILPFHKSHGIEIVEVTEDTATTRIPFDEDLVGNPDVPAIHGGVLSALVDLTGAALFVGNLGRYTPTIDMRVDYLSHAGEETLVGNARLRRKGGSIGVADIEIRAGDTLCATGVGTYKLSP